MCTLVAIYWTRTMRFWTFEHFYTDSYEPNRISLIIEVISDKTCGRTLRVNASTVVKHWKIRFPVFFEFPKWSENHLYNSNLWLGYFSKFSFIFSIRFVNSLTRAFFTCFSFCTSSERNSEFLLKVNFYESSQNITKRLNEKKFVNIYSNKYYF